ncbi:hypothetical protein FHT77_000450 [Rhizobium sp. BK181]|uniref:hypothetical protein n=1 Tax=Rhizobium sp. BK181 TaxID=2587072 RepID=UPI001617AB99|nr:hypothetical protein [Rhizobium sp. BK181]MBB3314608.1 hypothetical protein [Rhizobium sp. BK181]
MRITLRRPSSDSYQEGGCDGYDGGCYVCAERYLNDLRTYRAEFVGRRDAVGPVRFDFDAAYGAEFEIQWTDREIAAASSAAANFGSVSERHNFNPVMTTEARADGSVTVTERWSPTWPNGGRVAINSFCMPKYRRQTE